MEKHCENCDCVRTWTEDEARGELVCQTCGLVEEYQPDTEAGDNAGTVGEERFREAVDRVHGRGPGTVPEQHTDANGRPITPAMYGRCFAGNEENAAISDQQNRCFTSF